MYFNCGNTIERNKLSDCTYEYYVADKNGRKIKNINNYYSNPKEVAAIKVSPDNQGKKQCLFFRFYEFFDDDIFPKYIKHFIEETGKTDIGNIEGADNIIVKTLLNDNGDEVINCIKSVDKFLPDVGFIITLYRLSYPRLGSGSFSKTLDELKCAINFEGEFLVEPTYFDITYSDTHKLFSVDDYEFFDVNGKIQSIKLVPKYYGFHNSRKEYKEHLELKEKEDALRKSYELTIQDFKFGIIKNGVHILLPEFKNILRTVWSNVFIAYNGKYGFITDKEIRKQCESTTAVPVITNMIYDAIIELSHDAGYLCIINSKYVIDYHIGFSNIEKFPNGIIASYKTFDEENPEANVMNRINALNRIKNTFKKVDQEWIEHINVIIQKETWRGFWSHSDDYY